MNTIRSSRRQFLLSASSIVGMAGISPQSPILANQGASSSSSSTNIPLAPPDKQPPNLHIPKKAEKTIGWAIVGLGELALAEIMPAFAECQLSKPVALVSGHPDKARKVAALHGIAEDAIYNYDNYDKLAADNRVDAIYIVLPNSMHAEFTIRGLKAGKHVLCEKPMSATVAEAEQMIAAAKAADKKLMIAYRLHYEPFNQKAMELCKSGALGKIKTFVSTNAQNVKAPNIRLSGELAGGPVGDVGVYSINAARYTLGEEPVEVFATAHQPKDDPRFREVPESVTFILRYPSGALAHCDCSFGTSESRFFRVLGTEGYLRMDPAFSYRGLRLHMKEGDAKSGDAEVKELVLQPVNHFAAEMDHFSSVILNGDKCLTPGEMGLADMKIVEAIEKSWKTNEPVKLS